jgi:hypothetical protein
MGDILPCKDGNRQNDCCSNNGDRSKADQAAILIVPHTASGNGFHWRICGKTLDMCCGNHVVPARLLGPKKAKLCYI